MGEVFQRAGVAEMTMAKERDIRDLIDQWRSVANNLMQSTGKDDQAASIAYETCADELEEYANDVWVVPET